jgi:hypothetical protein
MTRRRVVVGGVVGVVVGVVVAAGLTRLVFPRSLGDGAPPTYLVVWRYLA